MRWKTLDEPGSRSPLDWPPAGPPVFEIPALPRRRSSRSLSCSVPLGFPPRRVARWGPRGERVGGRSCGGALASIPVSDCQLRCDAASAAYALRSSTIWRREGFAHLLCAGGPGGAPRPAAAPPPPPPPRPPRRSPACSIWSMARIASISSGSFSICSIALIESISLSLRAYAADSARIDASRAAQAAARALVCSRRRTLTRQRSSSAAASSTFLASVSSSLSSRAFCSRNELMSSATELIRLADAAVDS